MPRWHFPLWKSMIAVSLFAVLLAVCIVPMARITEYSRLQREMDASIRYLKPTNSLTLNLSVWDCAHTWTITAYCNVCFSPEHVSTVEMYRLREDLNRKLEGSVDLDTLRWIWDRLAQTGPHGKRYVERFRSQFEECFPQQYTIPSAPLSPPKELPFSFPLP